MSRFEYAADNLHKIVINAGASRSRSPDVYYTRETSKLGRTKTIQQAAMAMLTQANTQANRVVELIEGSLINSARIISNK